MPTLQIGGTPNTTTPEGATAAEVNVIRGDIYDLQEQLERDYYLVLELDLDLGTQGGSNPRIGTKAINLAQTSKVNNVSISRKSAPPPAKAIPRSIMSDDNSGGVFAKTARTTLTIAANGSEIASTTSLLLIVIVFGKPAT